MGGSGQSFLSVAVPFVFACDNNAGKKVGSLLGNGAISVSYCYRNYTPDPKTEPYEAGILARITFAEAGPGSGGQVAVGWTVCNRVDVDSGQALTMMSVTRTQFSGEGRSLPRADCDGKWGQHSLVAQMGIGFSEFE